VHNVLYVSQLKKCLQVSEEKIPMEDLSASEHLSSQEYPIKILETTERVTRNKKIKMCKVQWSNHTEAEATWKRKEELRIEFPIFLFVQISKVRFILGAKGVGL
jgi:hypothetical protein